MTNVLDYIRDNEGNIYCTDKYAFKEYNDSVFISKPKTKLTYSEALASVMQYLDMAIAMGFFDDEEAKDIDRAVEVLLRERKNEA